MTAANAAVLGSEAEWSDSRGSSYRRSDSRGGNSSGGDSSHSDSSRNKPPCKGCSADVHVTHAQINRILAALAAHPDECVNDSEYEQRLAACRACPSLVYDTTCQHCGCFVAVRAKFKDKRCPLPGNARW